MKSAKAGAARTASVLIDKGGADVNIKTSGNDTALHLAAANNQTIVAIVLFEFGAELHMRDDDCWMTPLCTACIYGFPCNFVCFQLLDLEWKRDGLPGLIDHCWFNPFALCFFPFMLTCKSEYQSA